MGRITAESEDGHQIQVDELTWWQKGIVRVIDWVEETFLPEMPGFDCRECGEYGHGWMAQDYIWEKVVHAYNTNARTSAEPHDVDDPYLILCLDCAQKHLGRPFQAVDFIAAPINKPLLFGYATSIGKNLSDEGEEPDTYDNYVPLFLWSFMLEQLVLIRASNPDPDERQGKWRTIHDYLVNMLERGPFNETLQDFGDSATETAHEIGNSADEFTWRRFLKSALDIKPEKESSNT